MALPTLTGTGRITHDPELRFASNGTAVCKIPLAFNARRKNQAGEWEDGDTLYINGTLFGDRAETAAEHLARGVEVIVTGRLKTRQWEAQDGQKRSATELLIDSIAPTLRAAAKKAARATGPQPADADPWATPNTGGGFSDEPPF